MNTLHRFYFEDSSRMSALDAESVDLVVTSPPYPMIAMWDDLFCAQSASVGRALREENGPAAFECMHTVLDAVWREVLRVTKPGGIVCINVGDATRTVAGNFALYTNHSRILGYLLSLGFSALPTVLWRKQTNAPNKFMGSGVWPPGAYVTLEHEYVLILRKGALRRFSSSTEKANRRQSALFWEERNVWFSDLWDLRGVRQAFDTNATRTRSAAFPFELAYRLVCMYSIYGDTVLDPFAGTGTTLVAALTAGRSSVGVEIDAGLAPIITESLRDAMPVAWARQRKRIDDHLAFVAEHESAKGRTLSHVNTVHGFPVMTRQETDLRVVDVVAVSAETSGLVIAEHEPLAPAE